MKNYHAHIYFNHDEKSKAEALVQSVLSLKLKNVSFLKVYEKKVGPHFLPMIEMHFTQEQLAEVLKTLKAHHKGLSVLVHEDSGDDFKDHEHCIWVGKPLPIDFDFFHRVKADSSISVH